MAKLKIFYSYPKAAKAAKNNATKQMLCRTWLRLCWKRNRSGH